MAASSTSVSVRFGEVLAGLAVASAASALLLAVPAAAETPGARTHALMPLEQELIATPEREPSEIRQPVIGYLRPTEHGWRLDMLPGAVERTGPLPVPTNTIDAPLEYAPSHAVYPYAAIFRIDF